MWMEYSIFCILSLYTLWLFYLAVMNLKRAKDNETISKTALTLGMPILILGYIVDTLVNFFVFTVLFLEPPFELTCTKRLGRLLQEGGWRGSIAHWFCSNLLDTFDPSGKHCQ